MTIRTRLFTRPVRTLVALVGVVALGGAAACAAKTDATDQADRAAAQPLADADHHHGHRHHHRPVRALFRAVLEHGDLSADQEAIIDAIRDDLRAGREARHERREQLRQAASEIVRAGSADTAAFDRAIDQATAALEDRMRTYNDAALEVHAILAADQRAAVADALRARIAERFGERRDRHRRKGLERIVAYLMLSQLQLDELRAMHREIMGPEQRLRPSRDELEALVTAFEGDDFETELLAFQRAKVRILNERLASAGEHTDTALAVLDEGQRALLADLIERGPRAVLLGEEQRAEK